MTDAFQPLAGQVALITGASRGIGAACARAFLAAGASVTISARDEQALTAFAGSLDAPGRVLAFTAAKAGVAALTKTAALDYATQNIRINAIAPGPTLAGPIMNAPPQARERAAAPVPVQRLAQPEEIAAAAVWLSSGAATYVTGTTLPVDGDTPPGNTPASTGTVLAWRAPSASPAAWPIAARETGLVSAPHWPPPCWPPLPPASPAAADSVADGVRRARS